MNAESIVRIGTRGSALARWQADLIARLLRSYYPQITVEIVVIETRGDVILDKPLPLIGGKGLFTEALEDGLRAGEIDLAVHSLKDLPTQDAEGLCIGAVPARAVVNDVLISQGHLRLDDLPPGSVLGTSSRRRAAQLRLIRPDLVIEDIRGNVPTRIDKVLGEDTPYHATILAQAGLERLGLVRHVAEVFSVNLMLPAPGQGALAVQCRDEQASRDLLQPLTDRSALLATTAERAFLAQLGGGCSLPVAAYASLVNQTILFLRTRVLSLEGDQRIDLNERVHLDSADPQQAQQQARDLGRQLATRALTQGADAILTGSGQ